MVRFFPLFPAESRENFFERQTKFELRKVRHYRRAKRVTSQRERKKGFFRDKRDKFGSHRQKRNCITRKKWMIFLHKSRV